MTKSFSVDEKRVKAIQELAVEVEARQAVINTLVKEGIDLNNPNFKAYHTEYTKYFLDYEAAKKELENDLVKPNETGAKSWNLDFNTCEITVEY